MHNVDVDSRSSEEKEKNKLQISRITMLNMCRRKSPAKGKICQNNQHVDA